MFVTFFHKIVTNRLQLSSPTFVTNIDIADRAKIRIPAFPRSHCPPFLFICQSRPETSLAAVNPNTCSIALSKLKLANKVYSRIHSEFILSWKIPFGMCFPSFPITTHNSTSRSTSQPILGIKIGSFGPEKLGKKYSCGVKLEKPIMQDANLLKMTGSFGTGKSCSEQWSRTGCHTRYVLA